MGELDGNTVNVTGWASGSRTPVNGDIAMIGSDRDLVPVFYSSTRLNHFKSNQAGVPIYDHVDMLKVYHPGEPLNVPERPATELDKLRFRGQWEAYKAGRTQADEGTPLSVLFPAQPEVVKSLSAIHISTVQQLANASDTATQNMMFGFNLREKAQKYLAITEKSAEFHAIQRQLENRDQQIKELEEKVTALQAAAAAVPPPAPASAPAIDMAAIAQLVQATVAATAAPARSRGWPKGKPRKAKTPVAEPAPISEGDTHASS